jgi:sugar phosphate isomerase/epimerase
MMQLGMMNNPQADALEELRWAAAQGFEFLDLTIEGPRAALHQIDAQAIRQLLDHAGMGVVGHTAWFLPFASPFERVRRAAVEEVAAALRPSLRWARGWSMCISRQASMPLATIIWSR